MSGPDPAALADLADLADTVRRIDDERQIHALLARLSHLADRGTVEEYLAEWAPDGEWQGSADAARGTAELRERIERYRASGVQGPGTGTRHVSTTRVVEFDGPDLARAESYFVYFTGLPDAPRPARVGLYRDMLERLDGRWLLRRRRISLDELGDF